MIRLEHVHLLAPEAPDGSTPPFLLKDVDLQWAAGEDCAVAGTNGAGKSLLLQVAAGLRLPTSGRVVHATPGLRVGVVFQNPDDQIVGSTVERDLAFGLENLGVPSPVMRDRVEEWLHRIELADRRHAPPHLLSEGEKQRLALGAALILEPALLLLDEPTSRLDPEGRRLFLREVRRAREERGTAVVLVSHRSEELLPARRLIVLEAGRVTYDGPPGGLASPRPDDRTGILWSDLHRFRRALEEAGVALPPSEGEAWNDPGEVLAELGLAEPAE